MKAKYIRLLEASIDELLRKMGDDGEQQRLVHDTLSKQMAVAASLVYDSAQDAQSYAAKEGIL